MGFLTSFRSGSEESFAKLYRRFFRPIFNFMRSRISDEETASELTQEVFLKVHRSRESYRPEFAFSTWLWTIAQNTAFDHLRSLRSKANELRQEDEASEPIEEIPGRTLDAEALLLKKDSRRRTLQMMRKLTRLQKRVLWMRIVHQLSYQEIARTLGLSLTAVKNLVYRARVAIAALSPEVSAAFPAMS